MTACYCTGACLIPPYICPRTKFYEPPLPSPTGWVCPVCGRGISPYIDKCDCQLSDGLRYSFSITCNTPYGKSEDESED